MKYKESYFIYHNKRYLDGTIVKFNKQWLIKNGHSVCDKQGRECLYGRFNLGSYNGHSSFGRDCYDKVHDETRPFTFGICIETSEIHNAIEAIVDGKEFLDWKKKRDDEVPEVVLGWIIYIALIIFFTLFKQKIGIWIFITAIWIFVRQALIDKASN